MGSINLRLYPFGVEVFIYRCGGSVPNIFRLDCTSGVGNSLARQVYVLTLIDLVVEIFF